MLRIRSSVPYKFLFVSTQTEGYSCLMNPAQINTFWTSCQVALLGVCVDDLRVHGFEWVLHHIGLRVHGSGVGVHGSGLGVHGSGLGVHVLLKQVR